MAQSDTKFIPTPQQPGKARHAAAAGGASAIALIALGIACAGLKPDEGFRAKTYLDIAQIPTECWGHADRKAKVGTNHTLTQCNELLSSDVSGAEKAVERCTPQIANNPYLLASATRLTYNIGQGAYCHSKTAKEFRALDFQAGCQHFTDWRFAAHKPILLTRREREMEECLKGI